MTLFSIHDARHGIALQKISLLNKIIELASLSDKFGWCVKFRDGSAIQDDYAIGINDSVNSVRNSNDSAILEDATTECLLKESISFDIDRGL